MSDRGVFTTTLIVLVGLSLAGLVLVTLASFVPDAWVLDSLVVAIDRNHLTSAQFGPATTGRVMDYFTDCIGATIGLGDPPGASAWTNGVRSPTLGSCERAVASISGYRDGAGLDSSVEYFRYWHGYAVATRPLIAVIGLAATRMVVLWLLIGVTVGFARQLTRVHGGVVAAALLAPVMLTTDLVELPRSLPHGLGATAALATAWWCHRRIGALTDDAPGVRRRTTIAVSAAVSGAIFLFFDILTIPPGAWALCVASVGLAVCSHRSGRQLAGELSIAAGAWIVGWAWMWCSKWLFASVVYGPSEVRTNISDTAETRLGGEVSYLDLSFTRSIRRTFDQWTDHPLTLWVIAALVALVVVRWWFDRDAVGVRWSDRLLLAAPAAIPLVWFEILRNHTQVHAGFTYRSWGMVAGIVAAALVVALPSLRGPDPMPDVESAPAADAAPSTP